MVLKIRYKKLIALLAISLILLGSLIWYREQTTNKEAPKRAIFVNHIIWDGKVDG